MKHTEDGAAQKSVVSSSAATSDRPSIERASPLAGWAVGRSGVLLELVEGLNESFIRSTEKGRRGGEKEQRRRRRFKEGMAWIFLAQPQQQEVGRRRPEGTGPFSNQETGAGFALESSAPPPPEDTPGLEGSASTSL